MKTKKQIVSPFGRAGYCSLIRPNFKFQKEAGEFNASIILPPIEALPLIEQLDALYEQSYQENLAEINAERAAKGKVPVAEIKRADKPYKNVEDPDTGELLQDYKINARLKFRRMGKNETTGQMTVYGEQRPIVVDSKNQPVRQEVGIGSLIRISFIPGGFFTAALGSGLSLKLIGVQVKELIQLGLAKPDFDNVEGFEADQVTASDPVETIHQDAATPVTAVTADADDGEWA